MSLTHDLDLVVIQQVNSKAEKNAGVFQFQNKVQVDVPDHDTSALLSFSIRGLELAMPKVSIDSKHAP